MHEINKVRQFSSRFKLQMPQFKNILDINVKKLVNNQSLCENIKFI